ncbi:DUF3822 family protein [Hymenobacter busanensis]|uniref:DUF3822 family protein n=1 Tax=Hymenobacter busanensis TaxID=2607656 RepID=A0A7L4ZRM9_9BACT|nr:DUF3822 family protein [Hymenobacter busanensis]KAA9327114.1 DUF3822 family protein [Hymenobacter busanensis]QHJ05779.1 DUF3822 family protein [Hymenobacter busanensis]
MTPAASVAASATPAPALLRLRDETLDAEQLAGYNLYLTAGAAGVRVGVADVRRNKFVLLEDYAPQAATSLAGQVQQLAAHHDLVGLPGWNRVRLAVQNRHFTLLPAPLFRDGDEARYLQLHHHADAQHEAVRRFHHPSLDMVSVFAAEKSLVEWFERTYPGQKLLHQTSALLEGAVHQSERQGPPRLYLSVGPHELTVVVVRDKRLEFCNVFAFSTPEDFIYYTILVMQELGLNPDEDHVTVWGDLLHDSVLFNVLRKYIRHVRFGNRPYDLGYSYRLNDVFEYRYFELYSLHLVE